MGFWRMVRNLNNAEGARESIGIAYRKHYKLALQRQLAAHPTALFGALGARWSGTGRVSGEVDLWAEVAPFCCMAPEVGREALAEYVVCIERPQEGRIGWLRDKLNSALESPYDSEVASSARDVVAQVVAVRGGEVSWVSMLREEIRELLTNRASDLFAAENLETLARGLRVPVEAFDLNRPLEEVLADWTKADLLVLNGRIAGSLNSEEVAEVHGALRLLLMRLRPLLPKPSEVDRDSMEKAFVKLYGEAFWNGDAS